MLVRRGVLSLDAGMGSSESAGSSNVGPSVIAPPVVASSSDSFALVRRRRHKNAPNNKHNSSAITPPTMPPINAPLLSPLGSVIDETTPLLCRSNEDDGRPRNVVVVGDSDAVVVVVVVVVVGDSVGPPNDPTVSTVVDEPTTISTVVAEPELELISDGSELAIVAEVLGVIVVLDDRVVVGLVRMVVGHVDGSRSQLQLLGFTRQSCACAR